MDVNEFRRAGHAAIDAIADHIQSLEQHPVRADVEPGYLRRALPEEAPEQGEPFDNISKDWHELIVPGLTHWAHPSFFAYFPTGCSFEAILGELYASSTPNPGFNWQASPACTELEAVTTDWAAKLFGLDEGWWNTSGVGGGVFQTSASDSALAATVSARTLFLARHAAPPPLESLVLYTTTQTHSLGAKAALVLGLKHRALPVYPQDEYALRGETLRAALEEDAREGVHPFMLIATVGTTSSGAVDRIDEIVEVAKDHPNLWIHVDAAWAGVVLALPEMRAKYFLDCINWRQGTPGAWSFCVNLHKWGLTNFDASLLYVRDRRWLTDALDVTPEFLRTRHGDEGTVIDYRNWHLGLGRRFRALKVWFVLRGFGKDGFRAYIRKTLALSALFADLVRASPLFEIVTPPAFALTVFRLVPTLATSTTTTSSPSSSAPSLPQLNALNRTFYAALSARSELWLTQTDLGGVFCVRLAVGSTATEERHVRGAVRVLEEVGRAVLDEWEGAEG